MVSAEKGWRMGEASITATWGSWGNSLLAGEEAFLQAKIEARVLASAREMPVMVSVAGGSVGRGKKLCLALSLSKQWIWLGPVFWG